MLQQDRLPSDLELRRAALRRARQLGMTLIEIMIVVVIMALVTTGVAIAVLPKLQQAKVKSAESAVQTVKSAVVMYIATNNTDCATMPQLLEDKQIDKSTATQDPWNHDFEISCPSPDDITVRSAGPDGEFDTADDIPKAKQQ